MGFKLILKAPPIQVDELSLKKKIINIIVLNSYLEFYVLSEEMQCFPAFLVDRVGKSMMVFFAQEAVPLNFNFFIANTELSLDIQNKGLATIKEFMLKDLYFNISDIVFSISQLRFRRNDLIHTCFCFYENVAMFEARNMSFKFLMNDEELVGIIPDRLLAATRVSNNWFFYDDMFFQFDSTINICNILNRKDIDNAINHILRLLFKKRNYLCKYDFSREELLKVINNKLAGKEIFKLIYHRHENRLDLTPMTINDESKEKILIIELVDIIYFISLYDFLSILVYC